MPREILNSANLCLSTPKTTPRGSQRRPRDVLPRSDKLKLIPSRYITHLVPPSKSLSTSSRLHLAFEMHTAELTIENTELTAAEYRHQITEIEMCEKDERMILHFSKNLKAVTGAILPFKFYRKIGRSPAGLYESS
jgi:hypothetical protein